MREEDIERFVAELQDASPFEVATTAVDGWVTDEPQAVTAEQWLRKALERCLVRYLMAGGDPPFGIAVIEGHTRGRLFEQSPCEGGRSFVRRLRREARMTNDPWVFLLIPQSRGIADRDREGGACDCEPQPIRLMWYFEARGRGQALRLHGPGELTQAHALLRSFDLVDPPREFDDILRGHPARQRHRISSR